MPGLSQAGQWIPYHHLGREVFLVPVRWGEDGWFQAGVNGEVGEWMEMDLEPSGNQEPTNYDASFQILEDATCRWCYLRDPKKDNYRLFNHRLRLRGTDVSLDDVDSPSFIGIRQSELYTNLNVNVNCDTGEAGITFYMDENHHYDLALINDGNQKKIILRICIGDIKSVVGK
jgi:alpha-N-arabinofuranosidase